MRDRSTTETCCSSAGPTDRTRKPPSWAVWRPPTGPGHPFSWMWIWNLLAGTASPGPLAVADIDGDGDLDLFVGGRFRPGHYPEPVSSGIWLNELGKLVP